MKNICISIWQTILEEIATENDNPSLFIDDKILGSKTFEDALCWNLAFNLATKSFNEQYIFELFKNIISSNPKIVEYATEDLLEIRKRDFACTLLSIPFLYSKGYLSIQTYRMAHFLYTQGKTIFASFLQFRISTMFDIDISPSAIIGKKTILDHGTGIVIGGTSEIDHNVFIFHNVTLGSTGTKSGKRHPNVRNGVVLGASSTILGNIEVGEGSIVAAGSVVLNDVPPYVTVAGNPARIIGTSKNILQPDQ